MNSDTPIARFLLLLGLSFFFGLAFEEFHSRRKQAQPGGIRSFPLLALVGALLYRLDTRQLLPMSIGLLILGAWLACFYWRRLGETDEQGVVGVELMACVCNVLAYILGPVALAEPPWVAVGATVTAVLFLTAREKLHGLARRIETREIITAGKFLMLSGLILPLLPDQPVTQLTEITPHQVWMAVLAVCTVSYASYLLQRFVAPAGATLWMALLGGLYSSTATTVVLARRARAEPATLPQFQTGIILATAVMYLRLLVIVLVFSRPLAFGLAPALLCLSVFGFIMAGFWHWINRGHACAEARPQTARKSTGTWRGRGFRSGVRADFVGVSLGAISIWDNRTLPTGSDRRHIRHRPIRAQPRRTRCRATASSPGGRRHSHREPHRTTSSKRAMQQLSPAHAQVGHQLLRLDCWPYVASASRPGWRVWTCPSGPKRRASSDRHT